MSSQTSQPQGHRAYSVVSSLFVASLLLANLAAIKLIPLGPFVFTAGLLLLPVTYIFGDVLTEVYGYQKARQVIWTGFVANVFMSAFFWGVIQIPPAPKWPLQDAFAQIFGFVPKIVFASVLAYWAGEFTNSYVMAKMKVRQRGRGLWLRAMASTIAGQAVDTLIFASIVWGGLIEGEALIRKMVTSYSAKVIYEFIASPLTYYVVGRLKKLEGVDVYDDTTQFTPFRWKISQ